MKSLLCPSCGSRRIWKNGLRHADNGQIQRYLCRSCSFRFSDPQVKRNIASQNGETFDATSNIAHVKLRNSQLTVKKVLNDSSFPFCEDIGSHIDSCKATVGKGINALLSTIDNAKVCVSDKEAKNLVKVEQQIKVLAGDTWKPETIIELQRFALWLQNEGIKQSSIHTYINCLTGLVKNGADLHNPKSVKSVLAQIPETRWKESYKHTICDIYSKYLDFQELKWKRPRYQDTNELIFIPTKKEAQLAINCGSKEN